MSIEATSGGYSPDTVYGNLTAPFVYTNGNPNAFVVNINSHTPYDKVEEDENAAVTQKDFRQVVAKDKLFNIEDFVNTEAVGFQSDVVYQGLAEAPKYEPPVTSVASFSASSLSKADIVGNALNQGYNYKKAMVFAQAQQAYQNSITNVTADPVKVLSGYNLS